MKAILFTMAMVITTGLFAQQATQDTTLTAHQLELRAKYCSLDDVSLNHMDFAQSHFKTAGLFFITGSFGILMMSTADSKVDRDGGKYFSAAAFAVAGTHLVLGAHRMRKALHIEDH